MRCTRGCLSLDFVHSRASYKNDLTATFQIPTAIGRLFRTCAGARVPGITPGKYPHEAMAVNGSLYLGQLLGRADLEHRPPRECARVHGTRDWQRSGHGAKHTLQ